MGKIGLVSGHSDSPVTKDQVVSGLKALQSSPGFKERPLPDLLEDLHNKCLSVGLRRSKGHLGAGLERRENSVYLSTFWSCE